MDESSKKKIEESIYKLFSQVPRWIAEILNKNMDEIKVKELAAMDADLVLGIKGRGEWAWLDIQFTPRMKASKDVPLGKVMEFPREGLLEFSKQLVNALEKGKEKSNPPKRAEWNSIKNRVEKMLDELE